MGQEASPRILIADDQPDVVEALRILLKAEGYHTEAAASPAGILQALEARDFDVLLMDLNYTRDTTSGTEGLDLLSRIQLIDGGLPIVVMTAWGSVELAVEVMRRGARDFVQKPWENSRLLTILRTQIQLGQALRNEKRLEAENRLLRATAHPRNARFPRGRCTPPKSVRFGCWGRPTKRSGCWLRGRTGRRPRP